MVWPERIVLRGVCEPVAHLTDLARVEQRLSENFTLRLREPQRTGIRALATQAGIQTLGRAYWYGARREARRLFSGG